MLLAMLFAFLIPIQFMLGFLLLFAALSTGHLVLAIVLMFVAGVVAGYGFRTAIASDISKFKVSTIVARLENAAKSDAAAIKQEVSSVVTDLKSHL